MYQLYMEVIYNGRSEQELLDAFDVKINLQLPKISHFLQQLKDCAKSWLPSFVNQHHHRGNVTTNRVEGFFGHLKTRINHEIKFLNQLFNILLNIGDHFYYESRKRYYPILNDFLLSHEDSKKIGFFVIQMIKEEYKAFRTESKSKLASEYGPFCCVVKQIYQVPCRHLLAYKFIERDDQVVVPESPKI